MENYTDNIFNNNRGFILTEHSDGSLSATLCGLSADYWTCEEAFDKYEEV